MGLKGQTGTSLGGGIVSRKQLKAQRTPTLPPVNPSRLSPEARARREAYEAEQRERTARAEALAAQRAATRRAEQEQLARDGRRVLNVAQAVRRPEPTKRKTRKP